MNDLDPLCFHVMRYSRIVLCVKKRRAHPWTVCCTHLHQRSHHKLNPAVQRRGYAHILNVVLPFVRWRASVSMGVDVNLVLILKPLRCVPGPDWSRSRWTVRQNTVPRLVKKGDPHNVITPTGAREVLPDSTGRGELESRTGCQCHGPTCNNSTAPHRVLHIALSRRV